jgi:nitrate reductase cytochrome c-type subunit
MRFLISMALYAAMIAAGAVLLGETYAPVSAAKDPAPPAAPEQNVSADNLAPSVDPALLQEIDRERLERASRRAFYTAPPVIPHELYPASAGDCLTCHQKEGVFFGKKSPVTPHPQLTNCNQCHLPSAPAFTALSADPVESTWHGLDTPLDGTRATVVAPPTMPHRLFLRESCLSCHSQNSPYQSLRCPHPERSNCNQCHVSSGNGEFVLPDEKTLPGT